MIKGYHPLKKQKLFSIKQIQQKALLKSSLMASEAISHLRRNTYINKTKAANRSLSDIMVSREAPLKECYCLVLGSKINLTSVHRSEERKKGSKNPLKKSGFVRYSQEKPEKRSTHTYYNQDTLQPLGIKPNIDDTKPKVESRKSNIIDEVFSKGIFTQKESASLHITSTQAQIHKTKSFKTIKSRLKTAAKNYKNKETNYGSKGVSTASINKRMKVLTIKRKDVSTGDYEDSKQIEKDESSDSDGYTNLADMYSNVVLRKTFNAVKDPPNQDFHVNISSNKSIQESSHEDFEVAESSEKPKIPIPSVSQENPELIISSLKKKNSVLEMNKLLVKQKLLSNIPI
ncbi:unnamed protein product [Moneuplotes crassus]|uniref:Uncharacterized protein n=1 Tax=Euplotes crassus TaxID=5936 RepID=A0AAD1Y814_EUPCR|nr:unnamed protein product [Moneuplotes crassus]